MIDEVGPDKCLTWILTSFPSSPLLSFFSLSFCLSVFSLRACLLECALTFDCHLLTNMNGCHGLQAFGAIAASFPLTVTERTANSSTEVA